MTTLLMLGGVAFDSFEVPARIRFGGAQALAVHQLPGGARVIDAMGRDDADISWNGVLSGPDAADRARLLDAMRAAGNAIALSWDAFLYQVILSRLDMSFETPWWIPYRLVCKVVQDEAQSSPVVTPDPLTAILGDLGLAAAYFDVAPAVMAVGAVGGATPGTAAYAASAAALGTVSSGISAGIVTAEDGLAASDIPSLVNASGSLAQLTAAQFYVGRATANLNGASS